MFEIGVLAAVMYIVYFIVSVTKFDKNGHVKKSKKDSNSAGRAADENGADKQATKAVTASPKSITMGVGKTASVKIGFVPSNATYKTFSYEVSKKGIVSITKGKSSISGSYLQAN